jgi:hypothetical protein
MAFRTNGRLRLGTFLIGCTLLAATAGVPARADGLTQKDVQILAKALGFLAPAPAGDAVVAIAFDPADPATRKDAETVAGYFGDGLKAGSAILKPKVVELSQLRAGGFVAVIVAAGVKGDQIASASKSLRVACITADASAVESGQCLMSVKSTPKVEILISRSAAAGSGVGFGSAFLLMAHEI